MALLGLHCCTQVFYTYGKWGLLFVEVNGLLIAWAFIAEHRLQDCRLQYLRLMGSFVVAHGSVVPSMWDLPGPGIKPVSLALAGGFLSTVPQGKSLSPDSIQTASGSFG